MGKVNIEINGKKLEADVGSMIIEVADDADIYIPRFCYHKKIIRSGQLPYVYGGSLQYS
ncbi:MAG: 2Fe-2S iron-sulfur cluster-binding protein [Enterobacterales bacterium]|nr:2Fe-2S iron-sulfur cluster-binding protein [Enterobacterales bacterium]